MDVGLHCSISACNQVDFLPFTCDCCRSVFCLVHRTYDAHACPLAGSKDRRVIECPLCQQMLHWTSEQDVNAVWERHVQSGQCAPKPLSSGTAAGATATNATGKKPKKPRCSAATCREILTASNQFQCVTCRQHVCLKHRFASDHDCDAVRRSQQRQWGSMRPSAAGGQRSVTVAAASASNVSQSARNVATTVVNSTRSAARSLVQNAKAASATVSAAATATSANLITTSTEQCPLCHQQFAYVSQLIAHVNRAHPDASRATASQSTDRSVTTTATLNSREVCPQCRAEFRDVSALIQHAETAHASSAVAAAAGTDNDKCSLM